MLFGATNALLQFALWALYLSFVQIGQLFYGYGWETQLLETGFLAIFLCPLRRVAAVRAASPPVVAIWLFRWLIIRIMLGAAAIKLRGDPCWRDFTCLVYHYETQPIPNPLSWWLHARPPWFHVVGVAFNHLVELIVPFFVVRPAPRCARCAGLFLIAFQVILILSGNLSFLNWLTIVPALACFDDDALPARPREAARRALRAAATLEPSLLQRGAAAAFAAVVAFFSINVGRQPALAAPGDEPLLRSPPPREHVRRLRVGRPHARRGDPRGHQRRGRRRGHALEGVRVSVQARRRQPAALRDLAVPLPGSTGRSGSPPCRAASQEPWLLHLVYKLLQGDAGVKTPPGGGSVPDRTAALHSRPTLSLRVHAPRQR